LQADGAVKNLNAKAWLALIVLAVAMGLLLFVPAGTVHYWQALVYLSIFTGATALITVYLMKRDPALLERRVSAGPMAEQQRAQKFIMLCTSIGFIALLLVPAFDHRFGWSTIPFGGVVFGDVLVALGFYLIFLVYRENTFTSATIEVAENQKVISTGPYSHCSPSDVRECVFVPSRHSVGAWLVLGVYLNRGDDSFSDMATLR